MNVLVIASSKSEHFGRVAEAVESVNSVQNYFYLKLAEERWLPHDPEEEDAIDAYKLCEKLLVKYPGQPVMAVVQNPLEDHFYHVELRNRTVITMAHWEDELAPPPLRIYLAYLFGSALVNLGADLSDSQIEEWQHETPIGCVFDSFEEMEMIKLGMVGANLCGECEARLMGMQMPRRALEAVEQILGYVRAATIRRARTEPDSIFIGHGRSTVWTQVSQFLTLDLKLSVSEFNSDAAAGVSTIERLQELLNAARFAVLVMTGEDLDGNRRIRARENVVHEIGLFQGRLGFRRAIVLKENGVKTFSNILGLTTVNFPKGKFSVSAKEKLRDALRRENLL